ncbi:MAG: hypothetical protein LCH84_07810 [Gemmatimonadetes bacterium]|nr:hypothetical protein [Gemmatimonadota bacterium]
MRGPVTLLGLALAAGCSDRVDATADAPLALQASIAARTVYPAKREEWRTDITHHVDSTMVPLVFRASRTTVALLQASPTRISQFELHSHGGLLSTRPGPVDAVLHAQVPRSIDAPTDLSRVTDDADVDIIDSATTTLVRESIGGFVFRRDLPMLRGGSGRICTVTPATLLHVRQVGTRRTLESFTITALASEDSLLGRHRIRDDTTGRMRFGSGDSHRCLLITQHSLHIVRAPEPTSGIATPRVERVRLVGDSVPRAFNDTGVVTAPTSAGRVPQPFIVDAAIVDGGYVVLVGMENDRQGRLIDYYDNDGRYLQSAMLPFTASAMAGSGPRFLVLHQDQKYKWWLSSWLTPMAARGAEALPDPPSVTKAPHRQLFEVPGTRSRP